MRVARSLVSEQYQRGRYRTVSGGVAGGSASSIGSPLSNSYLLWVLDCSGFRVRAYLVGFRVGRFEMARASGAWGSSGFGVV